LALRRQKAEHRLDTARDRDRNGQHVVDDKGCAGEAGRDLVAAASRWKELDDLVGGDAMTKTVMAVAAAM
jgi:hypothetical protein